MIDHRADCQLYTVPTYGLCTCDFDQRMDDGGMRPLTTSIPTDTGTIQERLRFFYGTHPICTEAADRLDALEKPFESADNGDWRALDLLLGHSAHGQYWRGVFKELRAALTPKVPT